MIFLIHQAVRLLENILEDMAEPVRYIPMGIAAGLLWVIFWIFAGKCGFLVFNRKTIKEKCASFSTVIYMTVILQLAFFSREPGSRRGVDLEILGTWGNYALPHEYFVENILMFIPFGFLFPMAFLPMRKGRVCVLAAFFFSVCLETMQLFTERGFCQIDDVLTNTLGAWLGWLLYKAAGKKKES